MANTQSSEPIAQDQAWDEIFNFDPTTSPFLPHLTTEHNDFDVNLDIFSEQPLFLPTNYLPQPNYYLEPTIPQDQFDDALPTTAVYHNLSGVTQEATFDVIRKDLDKVLISIWQLQNDYQMRIEKLDQKVAQAANAAQSLRKDVDAISGWVQQVIAFLNDTSAPSEQ
ncbi:predicted protein [Pyrenophora tritici-repentis Pt-1C-BFP]|uniref:Uncharacterized protein n=1 Tax=Pyrenophora tritici-repentis (strain Pt-1C-BFP) TaxID=426418 RepID=B2WQ04_PYRTR|nr:uncharacterized protein PTRG_12072 [Pyrenophora tritici-repentis Pt-1C-BFP]EDU46220.1 predicted protein [Pyrenophora tritici-repentis Pt-1C-BFP]PZC88102.1 hypothetical protein A1F95_11074 [Pyrenophora tritici-repentis]